MAHSDKQLSQVKLRLVYILVLQNEPEAIRMSQRRTGNILDGKGPSSQNWEGSSQDKLGKASLERFRSMQAACDLVGRYEAHGDMLQVRHSPARCCVPPKSVIRCCIPQHIIGCRLCIRHCDACSVGCIQPFSTDCAWAAVTLAY